MSSEAFGVIRPFTPFRVVALDRGWGKVLLQGDPSVGYVSGSLLHRVEEPIAQREQAPEEAAADTEPGFTLRGEAAGGGTALGGATVGDPGIPEEEEAPIVGQEELTGTVYVTRTGRKYHRANCKHLRSVKFAMPLAEAMLDFAPCRTCTPPTRVLEEAPETPGAQ